MLALVMEATYTNAQDVVNRCLSELEPLVAKAKSVWHDGNTYYGTNSERAERYAIYCLEACAVVDKYINLIDDVNEQLDLLWGQVDMLSSVLEIYEEDKMGLSASEYAQQTNRKIATLKKLVVLSKKSKVKQTEIWSCIISTKHWPSIISIEGLTKKPPSITPRVYPITQISCRVNMQTTMIFAKQGRKPIIGWDIQPINKVIQP